MASLGSKSGNAWNDDGFAHEGDGELPNELDSAVQHGAFSRSPVDIDNRPQRRVWLGGFDLMAAHVHPSAPPHRFRSPRLALMIASRRNALGLSHGELAERAKVYRPTVAIEEAMVSGLEHPHAEKPSLSGVVVPVARALGYTRREITLTWRIDQVESRLRALALALVELPSPALRLCILESAPSGVLSRTCRSRTEGALPFDVEFPESLRGSGDLRAHLEWAVEQCIARNMFGWLRWSSILVLRISSKGVVQHEFAVFTSE